jgi:hypothetical protein
LLFIVDAQCTFFYTDYMSEIMLHVSDCVSTVLELLE